ncbi:hypothetical protein ACIA78_21600 [Streptomyces xanthochromogenes]|uniref:hypothetical protein n=1 Tax=Streptomyces xanthochromogenes TaxID=67384 RepID=UPI0037BAA016
MSNVFGRWAARRKIGRVAVGVMLANELENGDLHARIAACMEEHGAEPVIREAVTREHAKFRRTARNGLKHAQLIELAGSERGGRVTSFFESIGQADIRAQRLFPDTPEPPGGLMSAADPNSTSDARWGRAIFE